jgi:hypothetical protein
MPNRLEQVCRESGCFKRTRDRSGYCADHQKANTAKEAKKLYYHERDANDPVRKLYGTPWKHFVEWLETQGNVMCQRLEDGEQCNRFKDLYHHLISPRTRPDLMLDPKNVIGLCRQHHPDTDGTPEWREGVDYIPTVCRLPSFGLKAEGGQR